jgi:hypothetical protein
MPKATTKAKSVPQYKQRAARYATLKTIENAVKAELKEMKDNGLPHDDFKKHGMVETVKDKHGNVQFDSRGNPILRYTIEINALGFEKVTMRSEWKDDEPRNYIIPGGEKSLILKTPMKTDEIQAIIERVLNF